jgi:17beta-estradiol 17-dehydrogenase / very-long-chain 3-oxoacyl-CoA reductase
MQFVEIKMFVKMFADLSGALWFQWLCLLSFLLVAYRTARVFYSACATPALRSTCLRVDFPRRHGQDAYAVVTGATDGLGLAYAKQFAERGMNVYLISRTPAKLRKRKREIEAQFPDVDVKTLAVDFSQIDEANYARLEKALGKVTVGVLVNNCGVSYDHAEWLTDISHELLERLIEVNVRSLTLLTRIVLPAMYARGSGDIVNVTSVAGVWAMGEPLYAVYSGSKGYVNFFSRSLHWEAKLRGVTVQCHVPHLVATSMSKMKPSWPSVPTPRAFARAAVNRIGSGEFMVTPFWFHELFERLMDVLPYWLTIHLFSIPRVLHTRKRALRKKAILEFQVGFLEVNPEVADMDEKDRRKAVREAFEARKRE